MALFLELLDMLRGRAARSSFIHGTTCQHGDDGEHLGTSTKLQDGEEVSEVVPQHIACNSDCVQTLFGSLECDTHGLNRGHDLNIKTVWLELWQVGLDSLHEEDIVGAGRIQPKDRLAWLIVIWEVVGSAPVDCQFDPILDGSISCLACSVDVTLPDCMSDEHLIRAIHNNADCTIELCFKCVWVRSILLSFLCHQAHVWTGTHGSRVKSSILLAKLHNLIEHLAISSVRNGPEEVFLLVSGIPHLATTANRGGQRIVNDNIARYMEISDAPTAINHCHLAAFCVGGHDVVFNGLLLGIWQRCNFLVYIAQTVVGVHTKGGECVLVLGEEILEVHLHAMTKKDRVRDLHHSCLQVKREENI
mmetsp:Transcript_73261/g.129726  ORF Transcript_73261/g.129726 Transcript_73261/m.129726 type:complete len:361 (+) Transcript_73261:884-1966(+)